MTEQASRAVEIVRVTETTRTVEIARTGEPVGAGSPVPPALPPAGEPATVALTKALPVARRYDPVRDSPMAGLQGGEAGWRLVSTGRADVAGDESWWAKLIKRWAQ